MSGEVGIAWPRTASGVRIDGGRNLGGTGHLSFAARQARPGAGPRDRPRRTAVRGLVLTSLPSFRDDIDQSVCNVERNSFRSFIGAWPNGMNSVLRSAKSWSGFVRLP